MPGLTFYFRWDCITVNEKPIRESLFNEVHTQVRTLNTTKNIQASEFELLTATAFEIFNREKVPVAVIEVGVGGLTDATNILINPLVTVISKIGIDHQALLGSDIQEIARQKAGIIKEKVPCVVDSSNVPSVLEVIRTVAKEHHAHLIPRNGLSETGASKDIHADYISRGYQPHQLTNIGLAFEALKVALPALGQSTPKPDILSQLPQSFWAGRLQKISLASLTRRETEALLDGAHNEDAAQVLRNVVRPDTAASFSSSSKATRNVTWIMAMSQGKNTQNILRTLLRDGDSVVTVEFGPVAGMPWVHAMSSKTLLETARSVVELRNGVDGGSDVLKAIRDAADLSGDNDIVITGSLYLVSDVMRLLRDTPTD